MQSAFDPRYTTAAQVSGVGYHSLIDLMLSVLNPSARMDFEHRKQH